FLTGFPGVNQVPNKANDGAVPSEMLRLNTDIEPTPNNDETKQKSFGVVVGDLAGFPNGRRPGDDVVDIALRVVMGALCHPVDLDGDGDATNNLGLCTAEDAPNGDLAYSDLAPLNADSVDSVFPYLKAPLSGSGEME
ncbi:MAG: DUF4331 family protein, partial [Pseudomonadota bacterium]|nr:DUF4331 family protein [Pseudomonadota bacterium]